MLGVGGCGLDRSSVISQYEAKARASASEFYICPEERVVVTLLPALPLECAPRKPPPQEVATDPGRVALWNDLETQRLRWCFEPADFLVEACGHRFKYRCRKGARSVTCESHFD